jgi:hypothetical protein
MRREALVATTAGWLLALAGTAQVAAAHEEEPPPRTITVTGRAEVKAAPDIMRIAFAVESAEKTAAAAAEDNRKRAQQVSVAVTKLIGDAGRLFTTGYRLSPVYEPPEPESRRLRTEPKIVGYRATNEVLVELRNLARAGELIDVAIGAGANRVSSLSFDLADRTATLRQAITQAGQEARAEAEAVAQSLGVELTRVRTASTTPEQVRLPQQRFVEAAAMAAPTPIEAGDVTVSATVQVTYDIE